MRYTIEVLYPWDDQWYELDYMGKFITRWGARNGWNSQKNLFGSSTRARITRNGRVVETC